MPTKIQELMSVDDSASTFDPDETTMEGASMLLLETRKEDIEKDPCVRGENTEPNLESTSFFDPDETMMSLSPRNFPKSQEERIDSSQKGKQVHHPPLSDSIDGGDTLSVDSISVDVNAESRSPSPMQSDRNNQLNRDTCTRVGSSATHLSFATVPNERIFKESYLSVVTSIIENNQHRVRLPRQGNDASIDDRIANLYRYMEEKGINSVINRLGIANRKDKTAGDASTDINKETNGRKESIDNVRSCMSRSQTSSPQKQKTCGKNDIDKDQHKNTQRSSNLDPGKLEDENIGFPIDSELSDGNTNLSQDHSFNLSNAYDLRQKSSESNYSSAKGREKNNVHAEREDRIMYNESNESISPIELPRRNRNSKQDSIMMPLSFRSPSPDQNSNISLASKKRHASTSGKKGMGIHRMRLDEEASFKPIYEEFSQQVNDILHSPMTNRYSNDCDSSLEHSPHFGRQRDSSFLDSALFSQSPIPRRESILTPEKESTERPPENEEHRRLHNSSKTRVQSHLDRHDSPRASTERLQKKKLQDNEKRRDLYSQDSVSPISDRTYNHNKNVDLETRSQYSEDISFDRGHDEGDSDTQLDEPCGSIASAVDSIESVDSDILRDQANRKRLNDESIVDDEEFEERQISLKDTSRLYYDPLRVYKPPRWAKIYHDKKERGKGTKGKGRSKPMQIQKQKHSVSDKRQSLPTMTYIQNPFKEFGSRDSERLNVVSEWLNEHDVIAKSLTEDSNTVSSGKAVVLSTTIRQIISLALQALIRNGVHRINRRDRHVENNASSLLTGNNMARTIGAGTLIVARSKDDLLEWECALREKTGFTVLNHAELSSKDRRRVTMSMKASGFDVVLSTYDALKTKEMSTIVDNMGRVKDQAESEGGWLNSRMTSSSCEEGQHMCSTLSQLHSLNWTRLILVDTLGRQVFLTKPGTSRTEAAVKLKAGSRLIFFERSAGNTYFYEDKVKESRRQLVPLAKILGIPENRTAEQLVGKTMLDFRDVKEEDENEKEIDSDIESRFSECSVHGESSVGSA